MAKKQMTIYAPASMANICVGFDILGAAISPINGQLLGDYVTVAPAKQFNLINKGSFVTKLPNNPKLNIVYQCWEYFCQTIGESLPVAITLEKNMPIGSGLGSSACSVVGALMALNEFFDNPFNSTQLLRMMGELEGRISGSVHYDNVAPCYLGGMQLILNEMDIISQTIPHFADWYWVMAYPGIKVSTAEARAILPAQYQKQTCIDHSRHIGGFIHACYSQQPQLAAAFMQDLIAEPYRQQLLPGFTQAKQTLIKLGALACGISGSGPTLFAVADDLTLAKQLAGWLEAHYVQNNAGFVHIAKIDIQGARRIERK